LPDYSFAQAANIPKALSEIIVATISTIIGAQIQMKPHVEIVPLVTWPHSNRGCLRGGISVIS
jgi:hypothetical protein